MEEGHIRLPTKNQSVELIVTNALKLPGVKVNRREFLVKTFGIDKRKTTNILCSKLL